MHIHAYLCADETVLFWVVLLSFLHYRVLIDKRIFNEWKNKNKFHLFIRNNTQTKCKNEFFVNIDKINRWTISIDDRYEPERGRVCTRWLYFIRSYRLDNLPTIIIKLSGSFNFSSYSSIIDNFWSYQRKSVIPGDLFLYLNHMNRLYNLLSKDQQISLGIDSWRENTAKSITLSPKLSVEPGEESFSYQPQPKFHLALVRWSGKRNIKWRCSQLGWVWDLVMNLQKPHRLNNTIMWIGELFSSAFLSLIIPSPQTDQDKTKHYMQIRWNKKI